MSLPEFTDEFLRGHSSVNVSFEGIDLEPIYTQLDRLSHSVKESANRHAEKQLTLTEEMRDLKSHMELLQKQQSETNAHLSRILVRLRTSTYQKEKTKELVRCNKELALALSKKIYHAEFKKRKLTDPGYEEILQGTLHPSIVPYVYLDTLLDEDSD